MADLAARLGLGRRRNAPPPAAGATPAATATPTTRATAAGPAGPTRHERGGLPPAAAGDPPPATSPLAALAAKLGLGRRRNAPGSPTPAGATPATRTGAARHEHAGSPAAAPADPASPDVLAEVEVLAFAADPGSEHALRSGLAACRDAQVWPGTLRTAAETLGRGHASRLIFVDVDGIPYPAGAIHELAAVCEVGTIVIALGSDGTARFSREILHCGVSDYLVKPITAAAVREAAARAAAASPDTLAGCVAAFTGAGGSGATTLAAAAALEAAARGRYVSVLDLSRTFPALAFSLDVEPATGLDQLLAAAGETAPDPETVEGVCARRSDRIALYGYRPGPAPTPAPPAAAVRGLLDALRRRSHLVIVDGLDDPAIRFALLAEADTRVVVAEPTVMGAARAARMLRRLGATRQGSAPTLLVRNHTRAFKPAAGARALHNAGLEAPPDVVVPFEPSVPEIADRGWPGDQLPRPLRAPLAALASLLLSPPGHGQSAGTATAPDGAGPARLAGRLAPTGGPGGAAAGAGLA